MAEVAVPEKIRLPFAPKIERESSSPLNEPGGMDIVY